MISMLLGISRIPNRPEASPLLRFLPPSLHAPYSSSPVAPNIRDSNAGVIPGPASVAEAKMERWLSQGGADNLSGPAYKGDRHKDAAAALGKGDDWTHSKILADNNIRLASVERRLELDKEWQVVKGKIQHSYRAKSSPPFSTWLSMNHGGLIWEPSIDRLNSMSKKANEAIISDSLKFNGLSPVKHSRPFLYPDRLREAIGELNEQE